MTYNSTVAVPSELADGVIYTVAKMSFSRRVDLMRRIRELTRKVEFLEAGQEVGDKMDAALLQWEVDRTYVAWGLIEVNGLELNGRPATPESLAESAPEDLFREAAAVVRAATGLSAAERKN